MSLVGTHERLAQARAWDADDPLRGMRDAFILPPDIIYLDGNSLGALPRNTPRRIAEVVSQWSEDLIKSWLVHEWMRLPGRVGDKIARLIGAQPGEVVATDSTSVNLYKCLMAALQLTPERGTILSEAGNFPTDVYVAQGLASASGRKVDLKLVATEELIGHLDESVAVLLLTHVHYKTARMHDMLRITERAHACGAHVVWDLSHSAGAVPVDLNACSVDFAVGCGYKYLNGGPGSPAYLFVARRHQGVAQSPLAGWLGHARPFDFVDSYEPADGINRFLCGTHPVLGLAALEAGVDTLLAVPSEQLWDKSRRLCQFFIDLIEDRCRPFGVEIASSREAAARGSQVGLDCADALPVIENLIARGVVGDFRAPRTMRFGLTPLYVGFEDVWRAVDVMHDILSSRSWDKPEFRIRRASG